MEMGFGNEKNATGAIGAMAARRRGGGGHRPSDESLHSVALVDLIEFDENK